MVNRFKESQFTTAQPGTGFQQTAAAFSDLSNSIRQAANVGIEQKMKTLSKESFISGAKESINIDKQIQEQGLEGEEAALYRQEQTQRKDVGLFGRLDRSYNEGLITAYKSTAINDAITGIDSILAESQSLVGSDINPLDNYDEKALAFVNGVTEGGGSKGYQHYSQ